MERVLKAEFSRVPVLARAVDRVQSADLIRAGTDFQVRETFESAMMLGASALETLGASQAEIGEISARIRERDQKRFQLEMVGGVGAGQSLFSDARRPSVGSASAERS